MTIDDLFKQANKYSMLEDDVRAATQQVLVTNQPTRNDSTKSSKIQANEGKHVRGKANDISQAKLASPPSTFHTTSFSP